MNEEVHTGPGQEAAENMFILAVLGVVGLFLLAVAHAVLHVFIEGVDAFLGSFGSAFEAHPNLWVGVLVALLVSTYAVLYAYRVYDWTKNQGSEDDEESDSTTCGDCGRSFDTQRGLNIHQGQKGHGDSR